MKILKFAFLVTLSISSFIACGNDKNSGLIDENEKGLTFKATISKGVLAGCGMVMCRCTSGRPIAMRRWWMWLLGCLGVVLCLVPR